MLMFFGPCEGGGSSKGSPDTEGITDHVQTQDGKNATPSQVLSSDRQGEELPGIHDQL